MIITSSHDNWNSKKYSMYAISGNRGKDKNYKGDCYTILAPRKSFWEIWHNNIGKISEEENNKYYIREFYNQVLSNLDPEKVLKDVDNSVLLCYESNDKFCHRHIVSAWLELTLGIETCEAKINEEGLIEITDRPTYIKEYLMEVMNIKKPVNEKVKK